MTVLDFTWEYKTLAQEISSRIFSSNCMCSVTSPGEVWIWEENHCLCKKKKRPIRLIILTYAEQPFHGSDVCQDYWRISLGLINVRIHWSFSPNLLSQSTLHFPVLVVTSVTITKKSSFSRNLVDISQWRLQWKKPRFNICKIIFLRGQDLTRF